GSGHRDRRPGTGEVGAGRSTASVDKAQVILVGDVVDVDAHPGALERTGGEAVADVHIGVPQGVAADLLGVDEIAVALADVARREVGHQPGQRLHRDTGLDYPFGTVGNSVALDGEGAVVILEFRDVVADVGVEINVVIEGLRLPDAAELRAVGPDLADIL